MSLYLPELIHPVHRFAHRTIDFSREVAVMAIINRTPDSFYDAGATFALDAAVNAALHAVEDGAAWLDIGGVPFAPGPELPWQEEAERVVPVIRAIRRQTDAVISADTFQPRVAAAAIDAGADVINDTTGISHPEVARVVADAGVHLVITHSLARPRTVYPRPAYTDVVADVAAFLQEKVELARGLGIDDSKLIIDPGHDLNKNTMHTLEITRRLDEIAALGYPVLAAVSNKDFIGETLDRPKAGRLSGSLAAATMCLMNGARILRMHQVAESVETAHLFEAVAGWRAPAYLRHNMGDANEPAHAARG
ncbi:dihydropteroate synthase [Arthrobacter sp.]|uniref:dihydropteroate synthase n=1 Tax=Arthrobacter sp. TaxID=1667 RepID=UPI003A8FA84F